MDDDIRGHIDYILDEMFIGLDSEDHFWDDLELFAHDIFKCY